MIFDVFENGYNDSAASFDVPDVPDCQEALGECNDSAASYEPRERFHEKNFPEKVTDSKLIYHDQYYQAAATETARVDQCLDLQVEKLHESQSEQLSLDEPFPSIQALPTLAPHTLFLRAHSGHGGNEGGTDLEEAQSQGPAQSTQIGSLGSMAQRQATGSGGEDDPNDHRSLTLHSHELDDRWFDDFLNNGVPVINMSNLGWAMRGFILRDIKLERVENVRLSRSTDERVPIYTYLRFVGPRGQRVYYRCLQGSSNSDLTITFEHLSAVDDYFEGRQTFASSASSQARDQDQSEEEAEAQEQTQASSTSAAQGALMIGLSAIGALLLASVSRTANPTYGRNRRFRRGYNEGFGQEREIYGRQNPRARNLSTNPHNS